MRFLLSNHIIKYWNIKSKQSSLHTLIYLLNFDSKDGALQRTKNRPPASTMSCVSLQHLRNKTPRHLIMAVKKDFFEKGESIV